MCSQVGHGEEASEDQEPAFGSDDFFSRILARATRDFFREMAAVGIGSRALTARINPLAWMVLNLEAISRERLEILPEHALAFAMVDACCMMTWMMSLSACLPSRAPWLTLPFSRILFLPGSLCVRPSRLRHASRLLDDDLPTSRGDCRHECIHACT